MSLLTFGLGESIPGIIVFGVAGAGVRYYREIERMIEGMVQEVEYSSDAARLSYITKHNGMEVTPDAAPTITIYNPSGTELVAATNTTVLAVSGNGDRGYLDYDAETAAFTVDSILTGGTSTATAVIEQVIDAGTTGTLRLSNIQGTFQNNETITDAESGSATSDGAAYTREYTYDLDASATGTYPVGEGYHAKFTYDISTVTYRDWLYFDVVFHTFMEPIVTSEYINSIHPDWQQLHPDGVSADWTPAIKLAHSELSRIIRKLGNRPAWIVKREELFPIELAFIEAEIAKRLTGMPPGERDFWIANASKAWNSRGEFAYDSDEDAAIDEDVKIISSGITR